MSGDENMLQEVFDPSCQVQCELLPLVDEWLLRIFNGEAN